MATMDSQYTMTKYSNNPVIDIIPDGYTKHVRDPKVWKHNDMYYMLLGAQRENKTGTLLLYKSQDLYNWHFQGEITTNLKRIRIYVGMPRLLPIITERCTSLFTARN